MPSSDTGNLAKSLVRLARESSSSPSSSNSSESVSLSGGERVDLFILSEDGIDGDLLLEKSKGVIDLLFGGSSVDLDLHKMSLLLV